MDYDPIPSFEKIAVPTLLFYGERDEWTPIEASVQAWMRARRVSGGQGYHDSPTSWGHACSHNRGEDDPECHQPRVFSVDDSLD